MAILLNRDGVLGEVPDAQVDAALAQGYQSASPEQAAGFFAEREKRATYSTPGQALLAGVEGAARSLTLGTSTLLERGFGVSPEGIKAREENNPIAAGVGAGVGILGPVLASGGLAGGAAAAAADLSAPALVAKAGRSVVGALEGAGAQLGVRTPGLLPQAATTIGSVLRHGAAEAIGGAAEGAVYGVGEVVHEAGLGDPKLTAERALSTVGLSTLLGGAIGGAFGLGGGALGALVGKVKGSKALPDWLGDFEAGRNIKAAGGIQSDITRIEKKIGKEGLIKVAQEMRDLDLLPTLATPKRVMERAEALQRTAGDEIGALLKDADAAASFEQLPQIVDIVGRAKVDVLDALAQNPLQQDAAGRLAGVLDGYETKFSGGLSFSDLHGVRRQIDEALFGMRGTQDPYATAFKDALHDVRDIVSESISEGFDRVGLQAAKWKGANRRYQVASTAIELADKGLRRATGNNLIPLTTILGSIGGGSIAGLPGALGIGAASYAVREFGAGVLGAGARAARTALGHVPGSPGGGAGGAVADAIGGAGGGGGAGGAAAEVVATTRGAGSRSTKIISPQRPAGEAAHYDVVEAADLIPSHDPVSFAPRRDYPKGVQERQYHSNEAEWRKVQNGGDKLNPSLVLTDTPTAVDGPPLITAGPRRVVLGGNGRSMMMQRAFKDPAQLATYKQELANRAGSFGLSAEKVNGMRAPVLVRVVDGLPATAPTRDLAAAVRRFNEGLTQELSPRAKAIAEAGLLKPSTVKSIGDAFADAGEKSLRDLMRERPLDFISILQRDGLITDTNRAAKVIVEKPAGSKTEVVSLTDAAKDWIEGMFLGRVVGSANRLERLTPAVTARVERMAPHLIRVEGINPAYSEIPTVQAALDLIGDAAKRGQSVDDLLRQVPSAKMLGEAVSTPDAATLAMVKILETEGQIQIGQRFAKWARAAAFDPNHGGLFGPPPTPVAARAALFDGLGIAPEQLAARVAPPAPAAAAPEVPTAPVPPPETAAALEAMDRASRDVAAKIEKRAQALVAARKVGAAVRATAIGSGARAVERDDEKPRPVRDFKKTSERIRLLNQSPEAMMAAMEAATGDVAEHAPTVARAAQITQIRAVQFLASKLPAAPESGPLAPKWEPSLSEIADFERAAAVVEDPLVVLSQAEAGTLTPDGVEAVATVYPDLFATMQSSIFEALMAGGEPGYTQRLMLSMLLGQDLDGALAGLAANQATFDAPSSSPSNPTPPGNAAAANVTLGQRSATDEQRTAARG